MPAGKCQHDRITTSEDQPRSLLREIASALGRLTAREWFIAARQQTGTTEQAGASAADVSDARPSDREDAP